MTFIYFHNTVTDNLYKFKGYRIRNLLNKKYDYLFIANTVNFKESNLKF